MKTTLLDLETHKALVDLLASIEEAGMSVEDIAAFKIVIQARPTRDAVMRAGTTSSLFSSYVELSGAEVAGFGG